MKTNEHDTLPADRMVESELNLKDGWDSQAVSNLIRSKSSLGDMPAFLFLGKQETALLREHLAQAFGEEAVSTLHDTYYMGLRVYEVLVDSFVRVAGKKVNRVLHDPIARRPSWREDTSDALWQLRVL